MAQGQTGIFLLGGIVLKDGLKQTILRDFFDPEARIFRLGLLDRGTLLDQYEGLCAQKFDGGDVWSKDIFQAISLEAWLECFSEFIEDAG